MATTKSLVWKGEAVTERIRAAQIAGVNRVMAQAVAEAKQNHAWQNRTGVLEGGINIVDYAAPDGSGVRGTWGVQDVVYARIHELGGTIVPRNGKALRFPLPDGSFATVASVTIPARPYLRPAGDMVYPELGKAIRAAYDRSGPQAGGTGGGDGG